MREKREIEIDLKELLLFLVRRVHIILIVAVIATVVAGIITEFYVDKKYDSSSMVYISVSSGSDTASTTYSNLQAGSALTADCNTLATSQPVLDQIRADLKLDMNNAELKDMITIDIPEDSHMLKMTVRSTDPKLSADIVNDLTKVMTGMMDDVMKNADVTVIQTGRESTVPAAPHTTKTAGIAGIIALIIMVLWFSGRFIQNDTMESAEDVSKYLQLSTLAMIPVDTEDVDEYRKRRSNPPKKKASRSKKKRRRSAR